MTVAAEQAAGARRSGQPRSARQSGPRHSGRALGRQATAPGHAVRTDASGASGREGPAPPSEATPVVRRAARAVPDGATRTFERDTTPWMWYRHGMAIVLASDINWSPPPRCPVCGVGITAYGKSQPFAVDEAKRVYCRRHGNQADASYTVRFAEYQETVRTRIGPFLEAGSGGPLTNDELSAAELELSR